jgi:hypothetical protein
MRFTLLELLNFLHTLLTFLKRAKRPSKKGCHMKKVMITMFLIGTLSLFSFSASAYYDAYIYVKSGASWHMRWANDAPDDTALLYYHWDVSSPYCDDVDGIKGQVLHATEWYSCDWSYSLDNASNWVSDFEDETCNTWDDLNDYYRSNATQDTGIGDMNLCDEKVIKVYIRQNGGLQLGYTQAYTI